jgi:sRNA-binding protein
MAGSVPLERVRIRYRPVSAIERSHGLKPNYQYEKRQREMEKKKKKAEKEQKKAASAETPQVETPPAAETSVPPAEQ